MTKQKILLVEDKEEYASAAKEYLASRDLAVAHARDYSEAISQLRNPERLDGAIIDCFFPERTGSNSINLGIALVDRIIDKTPPQTTFNDGSDIFSPPGESISLDYNTLLMDAMKESEANQPLGVLVAEKAEQVGLSFILATSTYHHDTLTQPICNYLENVGLGIVDCNLESGETKSDIKFWARAFSWLEEKLKVGNE